MQTDTTTKATWWMITINNPVQADRELLQGSNIPGFVRSIAHQDEIGEKDGTLHIQGVIQCKSQQRFSAIKAWLPRAHIEVVRDINKAKQYVKKQETAVEGTYQEYKSDPTIYVTPASFGRHLAEVWAKIKDEEGSDHVALSPEASVELCIRRTTSDGVDVLHLAANSSLVKTIVRNWLILIGNPCENTADWFRIDAVRNGIDL